MNMEGHSQIPVCLDRCTKGVLFFKIECAIIRIAKMEWDLELWLRVLFSWPDRSFILSPVRYIERS